MDARTLTLALSLSLVSLGFAPGCSSKHDPAKADQAAAKGQAKAPMAKAEPEPVEPAEPPPKLEKPAQPAEAAPTPEELAKRYAAAVADAKQADPDEVVDELIAIAADNGELKFDDEGRVLMVTWTNWDGYDGKEGQAMELGVEIWATAVPQMQERCRELGLAGEALDLRLEQLLGLPPGQDKDRVVALWVPTDGLFRPSPDPEIDDGVAELEFRPDTPAEHERWIEELEGKSYAEDGGYPWTRLGYTYDWCPDADSEVGLSEFVARKGTSVIIESVTPQAEYCKG